MRRSFSRLADPCEIPSCFIMCSDRAAREGAGRGVAGGAGETQFCLGWRPPRNPFMFYYVRRPCRTGGGLVRRSLAQPLVLRGASREIQHTRRQAWSEYLQWLYFWGQGPSAGGASRGIQHTCRQTWNEELFSAWCTWIGAMDARRFARDSAHSQPICEVVLFLCARMWRPAGVLSHDSFGFGKNCFCCHLRKCDVSCMFLNI